LEDETPVASAPFPWKLPQRNNEVNAMVWSELNLAQVAGSSNKNPTQNSLTSETRPVQITITGTPNFETRLLIKANLIHYGATFPAYSQSKLFYRND